eukprot:CAMPEP_0206170776 /NCGR_PEP_ID=MMETSP1474-20131121/40205_1 /ASSEMBLY_ACC=CAM_ASM_001110 /TAXON_ID=97495 /ORGANISM="Imantonia sp., Strain RCC918" /LENGTH=53 /DNA_ID=CAMNT_0053577745 /DNA_START=125 /DNA_END=283 /DNA_ORIENTATION=+
MCVRWCELEERHVRKHAGNDCADDVDDGVGRGALEDGVRDERPSGEGAGQHDD